MKDLMEKVAAGLSFTLTKPYESDDTFRMDAGHYYLLFFIGNNKGCYRDEGRIRINVGWNFGTNKYFSPKDYLSSEIIGELKTEITVSAKKDADGIIKDIRQRLMPSIDRFTPMLKKAVDDSHSRTNGMQDALQTLVDAGKELGAKKSEQHPEKLSIYKDGGIYGDALIVSGLTCNVTLNNVPISVMVEIFALLSGESSVPQTDQKAT